MSRIKTEEKTEKRRRPFRLWKLLLGILLAVVILAGAGLLTLTLIEYKPKDVETVDAPNGTAALDTQSALTIVTYNVGYAALGEDADFFMDGGKTSMPEDASVVTRNLEGIAETLKALDADIYLLQEVDTDSKRSFGINEVEYLKEALGLPVSFALNYSAPFVPYPIPGMLGKINSGLAVYTGLSVLESTRIQLPIPFSWPISTVNLKRCMLVNRIPAPDGKELVVIDVHLEAYDNGEGKIAQTKQLNEFIGEEAKKGNYVIVGGDFNQTFPGATFFPAKTEGCWMPGTLFNDLPMGFRFVFDANEPTCRLLDKPYKGNENPMYYIIDGFIVSSNLNVEELEVVDTGFVDSDHRPVKLTVSFN